MVALLRGASPTVHDDDYVTTLMHGERAFVRRGPWKLVMLELWRTERARLGIVLPGEAQ